MIIILNQWHSYFANLDPVYGYASFIPVAIAAFFGSSRYLATGPVAMVSLLTAVAISTLASGDERMYVPLAVMLALSVGIFQISLSLVKAGRLIDIVLKEHVILGFTSAAALIIASSQISKVFGIDKITLDNMMNLNAFLIDTPINIYALLMSIVALSILYILKFKLSNIQILGNIATLAAVVATITLAKILQYDGPIVGYIPDGLPNFELHQLV